MVKKAEKKYFEGIGRRKTATARVRIFPTKKNKNNFIINEKELSKYFPDFEFQQIVTSPLKITQKENAFSVTVKVKGGGLRAQSEAIRLGLARALLKFDLNLKKILKDAGYLTRDARVRERKKFGLKRARRARQWRKR